jgi:hypothetical protein
MKIDYLIYKKDVIVFIYISVRRNLNKIILLFYNIYYFINVHT